MYRPDQQHQITEDTVRALKEGAGTLVVLDGGSGMGKTGVVHRAAEALGKDVYEYASVDELPASRPANGLLVLDDDEWNELTPRQIADGRYRLVDILSINSARGLASKSGIVHKPGDVFPQTGIDHRLHTFEAISDDETRQFALSVNPARTPEEIELIVKYALGIRFLIVNMAKVQGVLSAEKASSIMHQHVTAVSRRRNVIEAIIADTTGKKVELDDAYINTDLDSLLLARDPIEGDYPMPEAPATHELYNGILTDQEPHRASVQFLIPHLDMALARKWGFVVDGADKADDMKDVAPGALRLFGFNARKVYYGKNDWASPITAQKRFQPRFESLKKTNENSFGALAEAHPDAFMVRSFDHDNSVMIPAVIGYTTESLLQSMGIEYYAFNAMADEKKRLYHYDPAKKTLDFSVSSQRAQIPIE